MLTIVAKQARYAKFLINENSTTILTGMSVAGVVTTGYLSGRGSFKAAALIEKELKSINHSVDEDQDPVYLTKTDKTKLVWRCYIPPVLFGAATIVSIVVANKIASKKLAALVIASGISERALQEYKEQVINKIGEGKARDIQDAVAKKRVEGDTFINNEIIVTGDGDVLCYDMHTGRYFASSHEKIKRAENKINYQLVHHISASLSEFYDELGLPATSYSDLVGWDIMNQMEVVISTVMSPDNRPCLAIDFQRPPVYEYNRNRY